MPVAADAILEDHDGRVALRFERTLPHPPERVWAALTELDDLRRWHPSPFQLEPRAGGAVTFLPPEGDAFGDGVLTAYEPPHLLAYSWGEDHLRWELEPQQGGTLLVLTHTFEDRLKAARDAAGWDLCLGQLDAWLAGGDDPPPTGESALPAGWSELNHRYQQRFGIAPAQATRPPNRVAATNAVVPLLMFTGDAEEAMRFYASIFFPARIEHIERYGPGEQGAEQTVKHATLRVGDRTLHFIDSPAVHGFTFTPSVSLSIQGATVAAVDGIFTRLSEGGTILMPLDRYPFSERFGWVTDRFGVSWQVTVEPGVTV